MLLFDYFAATCSISFRSHLGSLSRFACNRSKVRTSGPREEPFFLKVANRKRNGKRTEAGAWIRRGKRSALIRMRATFPSIRRRVFHAESERVSSSWKRIVVECVEKKRPDNFYAPWTPRQVNETFFQRIRRDLYFSSHERPMEEAFHRSRVEKLARYVALVPSYGLFVRKSHHEFVDFE